MKQIFSPAISLMDQLNYRKKFALLGLISFMAVAVLIYSLFLDLSQVVKNSQRQLQGLELIAPLSKCIQHIQQHQGLSAGVLGGNKKMLEQRVFAAKIIFKSIKHVETYLPAHLITNNNWIKIKNNWNAIAVDGLTHSAARNFSEHSYVINQLQFFKVLVADEYALTFDSKIDTFYLIDTSINKLPKATEYLGHLRAFGTSILARKEVTAYQKTEMMALIAKLESSLKQLSINLKKTAQFNKKIRPQIAAASEDIAESAQQVIKLVDSYIYKEQFKFSSKQFYTKVTAAINRNYIEMHSILLPATRLLIESRLQQASNVLFMSISISLALLMMMLYFGFAIYFSTAGSVQSLTRSLQLFADGDLHERINLKTQDELKQIGNSFNLLAEKITYLLADAENNQKKVQQVLDGLLTMAGVISPNGTLDFANSTPLKLAGLTQADVLGKKLWDCPWFTHNSVTQAQVKNDCLMAAQGESLEREIEFATKDSKIWVDFSVHPVFDESGNVKILVAEARDATRRRLAEEHSKRSLKMNALGKLVGGIAHDYNNMLGVILGYAELLEMKCSAETDINNYINEIIRAGERGRLLTRKMLAFSKSESSNPDVCNINQALVNLEDMLAKSLTASIKLNFNLCESPWSVWIDVSDLEDAVLNMCINAKYAMPETGVLTIETQKTYLAKKEAALLGLTANDYIKLTISDTGCGIDEQTKAHIFDPFFTTKGDAGNGLGLSQVFGFIERSGGAINVYSEIQKGTQFSLYFPRYHATKNQTTKTFDKLSSPQLTGDECILVVDDEPALRELAFQILTHFGYTVLTASSGEAALNTLASKPVHLVLSDIIMPNMDGYQLARKISKRYPAIKIQLASGFSDNRHSGSELHLKENILDKPYSSEQLLSRIRFLLDGQLLLEEDND